MCGIAGIVNFNKIPVDESQLRMMMHQIKHRGPDDEGIILDQYFGLGHVRLSIQDLSMAGHQPMFSNDRRYCIIFNGEIYNFIELRKDLESDYNFVTKTDTEVILAAYQKWGESCLDKFNGDWAFVIYDTVKDEFFGARDRFGIKPLYYYLDIDRFLFASEIKAIIPLIKARRPNNKLIYEYLLYNRTDQSHETFFNNVFKLKHGHYFRLGNEGFKEYQWYNLKDKLYPHILSKENYRYELKEAIRLRLRSDVPVGVSLSGGIDSSSVTSIVYEDLDLKNINTFSAIYGKEQWADESVFIDEYNELLTNMHFVTPTAQTFFNDFEDFIYAQGEPLASIGPYAQYKVMELAQGKVVVTLDGQGADEQLAGYHYFFSSYFKELLYNYKFRKFLKEAFYYLVKHKSFYAFKYLVFYLVPDQFKKRLGSKLYGNIDKDFAKKWSTLSTIEQDLYSPKSLNESLVQHFEYKLEHLLKWDDLNAMRFSIESRVPFLDHNLVEKTLSLPSELKICNAETKFILREAVRDILPQKIYSRRDKKGFSTPSAQWFRSKEFRDYIQNMLQSESFNQRGYFNVKQCQAKYKQHLEGKIDITKDIWKWINLEVWFTKYID